MDTFKKESKEITIGELINEIKKIFSVLLNHKFKIILITLLGAITGFIFASFKPTLYTAKITFVVEESKSGGIGSLGGLASLAGQFGVDVGNSGSGLFSGDNILLYFKSVDLAREVLLLKIDRGNPQTLADLYAETYKLKKSWESDSRIGKIEFSDLLNGKKNRVKDSLLNSIIKVIAEEKFQISRIDKKAGFIEVKTTMKNELLAKKFCENIVNLAVQKYIAIKIQRQKSTVDKLQHRVDSISNLLSLKTKSGAILQTNNSTMDINPLFKTGTTINLETILRDKTMLSTIFASVVQNLELAKFTLSQETPVIQIVDNASLPLIVQKPKKVITGVIFSLIAFILSIVFISVKYRK